MFVESYKPKEFSFIMTGKKYTDWILQFSSISASDLNSEITGALVPNIAILVFYIVIGILGNGVVIHIYLNKMRGTTDSKFFIPCLAAADILACVVSGLCGIYIHYHSLNFGNDFLCKAMWYSMTATSCGAAMILVFIAVHRYFRICQIYGHVKFMEKKVKILVGIYLVSFAISSPLVATSGVSEYTFMNITLNKCERIKHEYHHGTEFHVSITFTIFEALVVTGIASVMTVLYVKVGLKLYHHFQMAKPINYPLEVIKENYHDSSSSINSQNSDNQQDRKQSNSLSGTSLKKTKVLDTELNRIRYKKEKFNQKHKYTYIFIAISVICIVTYTPRLTLMMIETINEYFWISLYDKPHLFSFLKFLNRSYIINNIANPILYAMFDSKFKRQFFYLLACKSSD